jgi:hypothetical protein
MMSKSNSTILFNSTLITNTDWIGFAPNNISSYPLQIFVNLLGDLKIQNKETEQEATWRYLKKNSNEKLWLQPQVISSGRIQLNSGDR